MDYVRFLRDDECDSPATSDSKYLDGTYSKYGWVMLC